jgi:hypothetical protein
LFSCVSDVRAGIGKRSHQSSFRSRVPQSAQCFRRGKSNQALCVREQILKEVGGQFAPLVWVEDWSLCPGEDLNACAGWGGAGFKDLPQKVGGFYVLSAKFGEQSVCGFFGLRAFAPVVIQAGQRRCG